MSSAFRGLTAMLYHRRRLLLALPLVAGLGAGLVIGGLLYLAGGVGGSSDDPSSLFGLVFGYMLLSAIGAPLAAGAVVTMVTTAQQGGGLRRQELLALPLGKLVIPATVTLTGLLLFLGITSLFICGLSMTLGAGTMVHTFGAGAQDTFDSALLPLAILAGTFIYMNFVSAVGTSDALGIMLAPLALAAVCAPMQSMGYSEPEQLSFTLVLGTITGVVFLALPFLLYARSRIHWSTGKKGELETLDFYGLATSFVGIMVWGLLGFGWLLTGVLVIGGGLMARRLRNRPQVARRHVPSLRYAHGVLLVCVAPALLYGLVVDGAKVEAVGLTAGMQISQSELSPQGDLLAVQLVSDAGPAKHSKISRVAVIDLTGKREPRLFAPRFATLGGWSADGRQLVFTDQTFGRMHVTASTLRIPNDWRALLADLVRVTNDTLVYDVEAGTVSSLGQREVNYGWKTADELVSIGADVSGQFVVTEAGGRQLAVPPRGDGWLRVVGYAEGRPLLSFGFGPVVSLSADGRLEEQPEPQPYDKDAPVALGGGWEQVVARTIPKEERERGAPPRTFTVRKGDVENTVGPAHWLRRAPGQDDTILFADAEGLKRLSLRGGETQLLVPCDRCPQLRLGGAGSDFFLVETNQGSWFEVRPADDWAVQPLHLPFRSGQIHSFQHGRVVFRTDTGSYRVWSREGNTLQPLF